MRHVPQLHEGMLAMKINLNFIAIWSGVALVVVGILILIPFTGISRYVLSMGTVLILSGLSLCCNGILREQRVRDQ